LKNKAFSDVPTEAILYPSSPALKKALTITLSEYLIWLKGEPSGPREDGTAGYTKLCNAVHISRE
jgi:hypothetical protein